MFHALPVVYFDVRRHYISPSSQFHCFGEVATKCGPHHCLVGALHRIKFQVEQQHWAKAEWNPESQFKNLYGKTIEVFSQTPKGKPVYLGTHKAIPLENLHSDQFGELPDYVSHLDLHTVYSN